MEEPIIDSGTVGEVATPVADTTPTVIPPAETPAADTPALPFTGEQDDELAPLYEKIEDDASLDPNAPPATPDSNAPFDVAKLAPELAEAFGVSEYVKDPASMTQAVRAASEVWDVQTGKKDAGEFLDSMKQYNPERYRTAMDEVIKYVEWATGKKLGDGTVDPNAPKEDPALASLRGEVIQMKTAEERRQAEATQQQEQQVVQKIVGTLQDKFSTLTKGTWLEGDGDAHNKVLAQMDKNKVDPKLARTDLPKYGAAYEKAFKQVKNSELDRVKQINKNIRDHAARLRASTPATPGQGGVRQAAPGTTPTRDQFPEGPDGTNAFQMAYGKATGLYKE